MFLEDCELLENCALAPGLGRLRLRSRLIAAAALPGHFLHLRLPAAEELLLRRPFAIYAADCEREDLEIVYQVVGKGTRLLQELKPGGQVNLLGPCGRPWQLPPPPPAPKTDRVLLVGGGVGTAALRMLAETLATDFTVDLVLGAATAELLVYAADLTDFSASLRLHICTDDGSLGRRGLTSELAAELLEAGTYTWMASCGPLPMLAALAELSRRYRLPHQVSLEERMACGLGACMGCTLPTTFGNQRVCLDGPVFDAEELLW